MSAAFGMPTGASSAYLPEEQTFAGGVKGYSSFPGFEEAMEALKGKYPGMYEFLSKYNKINQGESYNPSQATPMQDQLNPQFNALSSMFGFGPSSGTTKQATPGTKGPEAMIQMMLMGGK
jgi:hypothetical protein